MLSLFTEKAVPVRLILFKTVGKPRFTPTGEGIKLNGNNKRCKGILFLMKLRSQLNITCTIGI